MNIKWNKKDCKEFLDYLKNNSSINTKEFNERIISTKYEILGLKLPFLRKLAKEIIKGNYISFLNNLDNKYYEIILLIGFVIANIKDENIFIEYFYKYLDLIDNWSLCDSFVASLKIVKNKKQEFINILDDLKLCNKTYYVRVGIVILLNYYIEDEYLDYIFNYLNDINSTEYYINMAKAWLIQSVFVKYPDMVINYFKDNNESDFVINKSISKIRDSYKVSKELKDYVLKFKR